MVFDVPPDSRITSERVKELESEIE